MPFPFPATRAVAQAVDTLPFRTKLILTEAKHFERDD
jgi:hypothetical protein